MMRRGHSVILLASLVLQAPVGRTLTVPSRVRLVLQLDPRKGGALQPGELDTTRRVLQRRLEEFGAQDVTLQPAPDDRLLIEASGITELGRLERLLTTVGRLEIRVTDMKNRFRAVLPDIDGALRRAGVRAPSPARAGGLAPPFLQRNKASEAAPFSSLLFPGQLPGEYLVRETQALAVEQLLARPEVQRGIPSGIELKWGTNVRVGPGDGYRTLYAVEQQPILRGDEIESATALRDFPTSQAVVNFELSEQGGRMFERKTGRHIDDYLAIILDGRVQGQPPVVKSPIGRRGQIELGEKQLAEAQDLAVVLTAGSLPAPLVVVDEQVLGPSPSARMVEPWQVWAAVAAVVVWAVVLVVVARGGLRRSR